MLDGLAHPLVAGLAVLQVSIKEVKRLHAQSAFQEPTYYADIANDGQSVTRISDPAELATSCRIPQLQSTD